MSKVLVVEISGKRPGTSAQRPTEKFKIGYDHLIISNNSDGYETEWPIVMVPPEYAAWYKANVKTSDNAWYAPMNRSYAIKYAREHGYDYLVQLDDNIIYLELAYVSDGNDGYNLRYRQQSQTEMMDDFIDMLCTVLDNTNAAIAGCDLRAVMPSNIYLSERFCYSFFALNLKRCPDLYHGDFEDDIEFRLKCAEMGVPSLMVCPLRYGKTGQNYNKDETGNRAAYTAAGIKRGEHMRILHGDIYAAGYGKRTMTVANVPNGKVFRHKLKVFKLGVMVKGQEAIDEKMRSILKKWAKPMPDKSILKIRKKKQTTSRGKRPAV